LRKKTAQQRASRAVPEKAARRDARRAEALEYKRVRLRENLGVAIWFTTSEAGRVLNINANNTLEALERLRERGSVRRRARLGGTGGGYEWCCR
jgi:hypothetical protein